MWVPRPRTSRMAPTTALRVRSLAASLDRCGIAPVGTPPSGDTSSGPDIRPVPLRLVGPGPVLPPAPTAPLGPCRSYVSLHLNSFLLRSPVTRVGRYR